MSEAISRRYFLWGLSALSVLPFSRGFAATLAGPAMSSKMVTIENFSPAGLSLGAVQVEKVVKADSDWQKQLSLLAFRVARKEGTEMPYTGEYASNHTDGLYHCVCCDTALYDSRTKFESGTGWPSFFKPISSMNIIKAADNSLGMSRDAISCRRCDAHLGHVFEDGPRPTGLRYCMNSVALHFTPRATA